MSVQGTDPYVIKREDVYGTYDYEDYKIDGYVRGHAFMTFDVLKKVFGLGDESAHKARSGNWQRDYSQVILPMYEGFMKNNSLPELKGKKGEDILFLIRKLMEILHRSEFDFELASEEFGSYDPIEHLDNPAGERASGVFRQVDIDPKSIGLTRKMYKNLDYDGHFDSHDIKGKYTNELPFVALSYEPRYHNTGVVPDATFNVNNNCSMAFKYDEKGIPVYLHASKNWVIDKILEAANRGKNERAYRDFSGAVHALQDYFFHSNFIEIAINIMLKENNSIKYLDSHLYPFDGSKKNNIDITKNLKINDRQAIATGTFAIPDTIDSIIGELKDKLLLLDPFDLNKEQGEFIPALLDMMEFWAKEDLKKIEDELLKRVKDLLKSTIGNSIQKEIGLIEQQIDQNSQKVSDIAIWIINKTKIIDDLLNELVDIGHKISDLTEEISNFVSGVLNAIMDATGLDDKKTDKTNAEKRQRDLKTSHSSHANEKISFEKQRNSLKKTIQDLNKKVVALNFHNYTINSLIDSMIHSISSQPKTASRIYRFLTPEPLNLIKNGIKLIPIVGSNLYIQINILEIKINKELSSILTPLFHKVLKEIANTILPNFKEIVIEKVGESNLNERYFDDTITEEGGKKIKKSEILTTYLTVSDSNTIQNPNKSYLGYWPPSHENVSKDHPPIKIGLINQSNSNHNNLNNWFHPIAEVMAYEATYEVAAILNEFWTSRNSKTLHKKLEECLNKWMSHPEDSKDNDYFWKMYIPLNTKNVAITKFSVKKESELEFEDYSNALKTASKKDTSKKIGILKGLYETNLGYLDYVNKFNEKVETNCTIS